MRINVHKHVWAKQYNKMLYSILTFIDMTKQLLTKKIQNTKLTWMVTVYKDLTCECHIYYYIKVLEGKTNYDIYYKQNLAHHI
jgi:hypothetical protein